MKVVTLALVIVSLNGNIASDDVIRKFKVIGGQAAPYGTVLGFSMTRSILECAVLCSKQDRCKSVMFEPVLKTCTTNDSPVDLIAVDCVPNGSACTGPVKYASIIAEKVTMRRSCYHNSECVESMSVCSSGTCFCKPGYSYHSNRKQCVTSCSSYGETFQPDEGRALSFSHIGAHTGIANQTTCEKLCIAESSFVCRTFAYSMHLRICQLQSFTSYERPDLYKREAGFNLYTRDCA